MEGRLGARVARIAAPAAFVLAVTAGVLLVRAGLDEGTRSTPPRPAIVAPAGVRYHVVRPNDTLASLARRYQTSTAALRRLNASIGNGRLRVGSRLRIR